MPAFVHLAQGAIAGLEQMEAFVLAAEKRATDSTHQWLERVKIPVNSSSPLGLIQAIQQDPWQKSGKYAMGWTYFCVLLLVATTLLRGYNWFTDRIRTAMYEEDLKISSVETSPDSDYEMACLDTDKSTTKFFPRVGELPMPPPVESSVSSFGPLNKLIALMRYFFYRPLPVIRLRKGWRPVAFPSLAVVCSVIAALSFALCYCFIPQPYFFQSMAYGSPPVAIRAGMIAIAMTPWIIAMSMKANLVSIMTGIGHERLNVLHRWMAYLSLALAIAHTVPFYYQMITDPAGYATWRTYFHTQNMYIFGTGIASLATLAFLCLHSLPFLRHYMYELFVALHVPVALVYVAFLFWHCKNYLTSYSFLYATVAIWFSSYVVRVIFYLNWTNPWRLSWLIGDESAVTILPENAVKVTIPTRMKWKPGQYVYLRMPGISWFENHPFTIASLCSDDLPSEYGEGYRDLVVVFRPFYGFTRKVLESAREKGPWHTYRAFVDGPYGGMRRKIESFDTVILIAGGSGITAIASQLLELIKRMRDGKAVTKRIQLVWALKRPETMEWFKEELRICRESAPLDSVNCQFYITAAKRLGPQGQIVSAHTPTRPVSVFFKDKVNDMFQDIADKRQSTVSGTKRHSALIHDEAKGDIDIEKALRRENEDAVTALPQAHLMSARGARTMAHHHLAGTQTPPSAASEAGPEQAAAALEGRLQGITAPVPVRSLTEKRRMRNLSLDVATALQDKDRTDLDPNVFDPDSITAMNTAANSGQAVVPSQTFDFGFPTTPTEFQKNLMRFAFLPSRSKQSGWSTEYGRPDLRFMLRNAARDWEGRTCVFVCGPPSMRVDVQGVVSDLQWEFVVRNGPPAARLQPGKRNLDEIFMHAENYAI